MAYAYMVDICRGGILLVELTLWHGCVLDNVA